MRRGVKSVIVWVYFALLAKTNSRDSELGGAETRDRVVKVNANCMTERRTTLTVEQYNFLDTP